MSFNKTATAPQTVKKTVPNFLQKKKDATLINANPSIIQNSTTPPQNTFQSPQSSNTQKQSAQISKQKNSTLQIKEGHVQIEKEQFPQLQKVREKDPRQLDVNIQKCKEVYDFYERKGRNELLARELGNALRSLGYLVSTREIRELQENLQKYYIFYQLLQYDFYSNIYFDKITEVKVNNQIVSTGFIEFKDFLVAVHLVQHRLPNEKELLSALQIFDKSSAGSINKDMLKGVLTKIGDIIPEKEFDTLFSTIYADQNGNIPMQYILGTLLKYPQA